MKAIQLTLRALSLTSILILAACGTTSSLQPSAEQAVIDLRPYTRLLVEDFADEATTRAKPEVQPVLQPKMDIAVKLFPDQIASVVRAGNAFDETVREGDPEANTLVLRGAITQYDDGNAVLRWLVGFGAGNTNFDASLQLVDGGTGEILGTWLVDKNSWALGGGVAATQTPDTFMAAAAKKIGSELVTRKKAGHIEVPASAAR